MWLNREGSIPMHKPRICVIIPTYNSARFLPEAVESALYQTFSPEEVIVVDDGSTDNTEDVLEPFRGRIHYIRQENQGPAVARNRGISEAKGDLIAFLDADDVWVPDKSEKQVDLLMENPRIGLVHSLYDYLDMAREQRLVPRHGHDGFFGDCYLKCFRRCGVQTSTVLVRKKCVMDVGGFDETIRSASCEDYDLWLRIARHFEFAYIDSPLAHYRMHSTNSTKSSAERRITHLEAELYVIRKALSDDPDLEKKIGRRGVHDRFFELYSAIGYHYHDAFMSAKARSFLRKALRHHWIDPYTWALYLANTLPSNYTRGLRSLKRAMVSLRPAAGAEANEPRLYQQYQGVGPLFDE